MCDDEVEELHCPSQIGITRDGFRGSKASSSDAAPISGVISESYWFPVLLKVGLLYCIA